MLEGSATKAYTDFSQFAEMRRNAQQAPNSSLEEVAKQFESLFINMVLKSMRDASFGDPMFDSNQSEFYQDMFDKQIAVDMAKDKGIGLADTLIQQMQKYLPNDTKNKSINNISSNNDPFVLDRDSTHFKSHEQFVNTLLPYAEQAAEKLGLDPRVLVAQAALETGWGKAVGKLNNGNSSFNLFNIKAGSQYTGNQYAKNTIEYLNGTPKLEAAKFRAYNNYQESFNDYVNLIQNSPRYQDALRQSSDSEAYLNGIQKAGYATDPNYAEKVNRVLVSMPNDIELSDEEFG